MREAPVKRGDVLAGKYRVDAVLGVGGMGVVVAVTHLELLETRAIKLMLPEALESAHAVERFMREARAASRLSSEHVARVYDVGRLDDGAPYMVMEYLAGTDLRSLLRQRGRIPVVEAVHYALQACEALAEAHALGIVHRDLKPANLFLTTRRDGSPCVKVLDFGISKVRGTDDPEMTSTQAVLGSPTYMSPEQMRSSRSVDARSDIWSLGVILYRLITGLPPFQAENLTELIALVLSTAPTPTSALVHDVPEGFDDVLLRCLQRDLDQRWQNVGELAAALLPFAPEEARASVERISRLLDDAPTLPPAARRAPRNLPPRAATGTHSPWARTPPGGGSISMRRWTFVLMAAIATGLALSGAVALVLSTRVGHTFAAAHPRVDVPDAAAAHVAAPPPKPLPPPPPPPPVATAEPAAEPSPPTPKPAERAVWPRAKPRPPPADPRLDLPPPRSAPTAANRLFGTDN